MRTPKPRTTPTTLVELILDLDQRMQGGDALSEVQLPADEWIALVHRAEEEEEDRDFTRLDRADDLTALLNKAFSERDELKAELARVQGRESEAVMQSVRDAARADANAAELSALKAGLAAAVGWGPLNGADELLQVVRGYVMALEIERARIPATLGAFTPAKVEHVEDQDCSQGCGPPVNIGSVRGCPCEGACIACHEPSVDAAAHAQESYCLSCRKWFRAGTHAAHKGKIVGAQAELKES